MFKAFKIFIGIVAISICSFAGPSDSAWIPIFNGQDLDDWIIKFSDRPLGENPFNSFSVNADSGWLVVTQTEDYSDVGYGQISYEARTFSYMMVRVEYKFTSRLAPGYDWWAEHNNGVMVHSQSITTFTMDQWFPNSIELQLMGEFSATSGKTGNLCTPGTDVHINGRLRVEHCTNVNHPPLDHSKWTRVEGIFLGDSLGVHIVQGLTVLTYQGLVMDDNTPLSEGYIMLQAEGAGTIFRRLDVLDLEGCMDESALNYRDYLVKHDASSCEYESAAAPGRHEVIPGKIAVTGGQIRLEGFTGSYSWQMTDLQGQVIKTSRHPVSGGRIIPVNRKGIFLVSVETSAGIQNKIISTM